MFDLCIPKLLSSSCDSDLIKNRPSDLMSVRSIFDIKYTKHTLVYTTSVWKCYSHCIVVCSCFVLSLLDSIEREPDC
jgi:hypothetical protein